MEQIKNASIFEIPLYNNLGFGYAKVFDGTILNIYAVIVNFFDFRNEIPFGNNKNWEWFNEIDYLCPPISAIQTPPQRNNPIIWRKLGNIGLKEEDLLIPCGKFPSSFNMEFNNQFWNVIKVNEFGTNDNSTSTSLGYYKYEDVKHLGDFGFIYPPIKYLSLRLNMQWMCKLGTDFRNYYSNLAPKDFLDKQKTTVSSTEMYSVVPKEIRGIPQGRPVYMNIYDLPYNKHLKVEKEKENVIIKERADLEDKMRKELLAFYNDVGKTSRKKMIDKSIELQKKYGL